MVSDPKCLVANAYDEITECYLERFGASTVRHHWLSELLGRLPTQGGARERRDVATLEKLPTLFTIPSRCL
jgi:hypothetical protein